MKLYVKDPNKRKIYLKVMAPNRRILAARIGGTIFWVNGQRYTINDVTAEAENSGAPSGIIIGGLIGLLAGPVGAIAGSTIGGLIGNSNDSQESENVKTFNTSQLL